MAGTGTLITVAPTGAESKKSEVPALPVTLAELVSTAKECEALGASVSRVATPVVLGVAARMTQCGPWQEGA